MDKVQDATTTLTLAMSASTDILVARVTGNDLPDDVWRIIAFYVNLTPAYRGLPSIFKFISVNRTFLDVVLSIKYRNIHWITLDNIFLRMLERLQDPFIVKYVKRLSIRAWFIDLLFKNNTILKFSSTKVQPGVTGINYLDGLLDKLWISTSKPPPDTNTNTWGITRPQKTSESGDSLWKGLTSSTIFSMLINTITKMTNVLVLDFDWRDLPSNPLSSIFLTTMRKAFSSSLQTLVLKAQIPKFKNFLEMANFENLDELELHFDYQSLQDDTSTQELHSAILPFIHTQRERLRSLVISSSSSVDLASLFNAFPMLPKLRSFATDICFDDRTLSDHSGVFRLLQSSTLLHVSIQTRDLDGSNSSPLNGEEAFQLKKNNWYSFNQQLLSHNKHMRNLESLKLPALSLERTFPLIRRSCNTLTRIYLTDRFLTEQNVIVLAECFSDRIFQLQHLHIGAVDIDFSLMMTLSGRFAGLSSLVLVYRGNYNFYGHEDVLERKALADWKLVELQIHHKYYHPFPDDNYGITLYDASHSPYYSLVTYVPSIRILNGRRPRYRNDT